MIYKLLREVCDIQYGYAFDSNLFSEDQGLPLVRIRDVVRGYSETRTTEQCPDNYIVNNGDLLIGMDGEFNIAKWKGGKALLNQRVCKLIPKSEIIEPDYLYYYMPIALKAIEDKTPFVTVKHLSAKEINKISVPVPDIQEQRKSAKGLALAEHLINSLNTSLKKLDELIKSRSVEMFGDPELNTKSWCIRELSEIILHANNGLARRGKDENGNIVLRLVELQDGYIDYSSPNRIALTCKEKERYLLVDGDILFARVNGNPDNVGRCAVFQIINEPVYHNDHIIRVHFNNELLNGIFLSVLLNSNYGKKQIKSKIKTSAGQYTISQDGIGAINTIVPPIELQNQFADFVTKVEQQKVTVQKSIDRLETLKKSLMQEYFG